jgi:hypothetical protein
VNAVCAEMPARKPAKAPSARVEAIVARNAAVAVVFRRGPVALRPHAQVESADVNGMKFEPIAAPKRALKWP